MTVPPNLMPEERRGPLAWMTQNSVAANILMFVLVAAGIAMLISEVRQEVFPEVELDLVLVNIAYPGASPEEVEQGVVLAVEEAIRGLDGIKEVRSTASESVAVVAVELLLGTNPNRALADVKSAIDRVTSFPEDIERPVVSLISTRREAVSVVLYGDQPEMAMRELAERTRRELLANPGITYVDLDGIRPLEVSVEITRESLREHGLSIEQVAGAIRRASVEVPGGNLRTESGDILLRTSERRNTGEEFGEIALLSRPDGTRLRVSDVATVTDGFADVDDAAFFNGQRAVMVRVYRVGSETPLEVSEIVNGYVESLRERLPEGVGASIWADTAELYEGRVELLMRNARLGLILVLLILGMFLEPRLAFWVTLGIPISFAGSLIFLPTADVSINMISLFAFIVTLGMVVDDAIIVGESIYQYRERGDSIVAAAVRGVREVAVPVTFSIVTTCVAFAPMLFVPGVMGKFFRVIPIVVILVLLMSLIESVLILPAHLAHRMNLFTRVLLAPFFLLMKLLQAERVGRWLQRFIRERYQPFLRAAVEWRYVTVACCLALLAPSCAMPATGHLQFTFMPKIDGDVIAANLAMPVGTPNEVTTRYQERLTDTLAQTLEEFGGPEMSRGIYGKIGSTGTGDRGPMAQFGSSGSHLTHAMVYLVSSDVRDFSAREFTTRWRALMGEVPGAESLTFKFEIGHSGGSPIDIRLSHADPEILETAAEELALGLQRYAGVRDIDDGFAPGKEQLDFHLRPEARALGLIENDLARQVRSSFYGAEALRQQRGRDEIRVFVRLPEAQRRSLRDLEQMMIRTPTGGEMPLGQAVEIERGNAYTQIRRTGGRRTINVTADINADITNANEVVRGLELAELATLERNYPGLTYEMSGQQREQSEALSSLGVGFILALFVMFGLLAVVFKSYAQPLIVLSAIPFGFVGAVFGHLLMGYDFSIMSAMGIVALSGVVVNDSLILIVAVNRYRDDGKSAFESVIAGGVRRFRPILLTSLTTFFGLAPMIIETSVQARFLIPMALSLGFGVLFATFVILLLVPATYMIVEDGKKAARWVIDLYQGPDEGGPDDTEVTQVMAGAE